MSFPAPYNPIEGIPEIFRAKLFKLEQVSNKWTDIGLGYPKIIQTNSNSGYLLKFYLEKTKSEVFSENLQNDLVIENPKDKQITISNDTTEEDIAISFQNDAGRLALWKQIKDVKSNISYQQQEEEFKNYKKQFEETEEDGQFILPIPNMNNLEQFLKIIQETPLEDRNVISSEMMVRQGILFRNFREIFKKCENENNLENLNILCDIFKSLIFYSEHELLQVLLSEENYILTFGILEYDEQMYNKQKETHRQFFQNRAKFLTVAQFKDQTKIDDIHFNFRLQYLRDSAMAHLLDESTLSLMNLISQRIYKTVVQYIITNREIISQVLNALNQKDYQALSMVYDMFQTMKNMDNFLETSISIYDVFNERMIFEMLDSFLRNYEKPNQGNQIQNFGIQRKKQQVLDEKQLEKVPQMIVQILIQYLNNKPTYLLKYMRSMEEKIQKYRFFSLICDSMMNSKYISNQLYFCDLLKLILENSIKSDDDYVFVEQFISVHLSKMMETFCSSDYSEEKNFARNQLLEIIITILRNLDNISMFIPGLSFEIFLTIPKKVLPIFDTNYKYLCSSVISLFVTYIEINKPELLSAIYETLVPIMKYLINKIKNKSNLIYSEIIKLFRFAQTSQLLMQGLNKVYQRFLNDIRRSIPPDNNVNQQNSSLFNITNVRMSLDSHKRFDNILGRDEIDIDFIRNGSSSPNSKSQLGNNSTSPIKQNYHNFVNYEDYEDDDHEAKDVIQKHFKSSK